MADASHIEVLKPGLATSVQDKGRQGYYHLGIPPSGALDQYAGGGQPVGGQCRGRGGAGMHAAGPGIAVPPRRADRRPAPPWRRRSMASPCPATWRWVPAGSRLSFEFVSAGARACLAVAGGIDVPVVLGSRSTYTLGAIGGHEGRRLKAGDKLAVGHLARARAGRELPLDLAAHCPKTQTLRVLPGLYDHRLEPESAATFYQDAWTVTSEADRIGYRYNRAARCAFASASSPSARARIRPTSSTPAIPSARSRCRPAWSPSSCTATRCPAAATP